MKSYLKICLLLLNFSVIEIRTSQKLFSVQEQVMCACGTSLCCCAACNTCECATFNCTLCCAGLGLCGLVTVENVLCYIKEQIEASVYLKFGSKK